MSVGAYFRVPGHIQRLREGPLGGYIDLYASRLVEEGFHRPTAWRCLRLIADFSHWLEAHCFSVSDVNEELVARYLTDRAEHRRPQKGDRPTLRKLLAVLRQVGAIAPLAPVEPGTADRIFSGFAGHLARERGLVPVTVVHHLPVVRLLLQEIGIAAVEDFAKLDQATIIGFVERHARDHSPAAAKSMCWSLRAFLRYLRVQGWISLDLAMSVPTVRRWRQTALPTYLSAQQVQQVLDGCDRQSAVGRRDFAVLMLLARLGLRAKEVATLMLDDLDWRSGQLLVNGKTRQRTPMPLPPDVGAAIADYLRDGRPRATCRRVFLRNVAPHVGFASSASIFLIANTALQRAGISGFAHMGAHLFRHSLATELLRSGASLSEIGQLLRHRDPDTTRAYAKVDLHALRGVSSPWPGGVP